MYELDRANQFFRDKLAFTTGVHELDVMLADRKSNPVVIDVRYPTDFAASHIPSAINLPKGKWDQPKGLSKDAIHYVYCYNQTCHLAAEAAAVLTAQGYRVVEVEGGFDAWLGNGYRTNSAAQSSAQEA